MSGRDLPTIRVVEEPLTKLVPRGAAMSAYSPFFTTESEIQRALNAGMRVHDRLGLPIASEAPVCDA